MHIFEARYRAMVMDALARDRRLVLVKLRPGYEATYAGRPAVHRVAGAGEIVNWERLATGRHNILVTGTTSSLKGNAASASDRSCPPTRSIAS